MAATQRLLALSEVGLADVPDVGVKAAVLGELAASGLPVPDAVVLTTGAQISPHVSLAALARVGGLLGDGPYAVRSSLVDERDASGCLAAMLKVEPAGLAAAVRQCWAWAAASADEDGPLPLAVIIQRMVPADAAGAVCTADPETGDRSVVVVTGGVGLGGGGTSPDEWVVRDGEASCRACPQDAVDEASVLRLAALALRAETALAGDGPLVPQDVDWAMRGRRLYLLRSRPLG
jgi:phosphoenolpyruvate synthase/pyruvate phosphate dikinase